MGKRDTAATTADVARAKVTATLTNSGDATSACEVNGQFWFYATLGTAPSATVVLDVSFDGTATWQNASAVAVAGAASFTVPVCQAPIAPGETAVFVRLRRTDAAGGTVLTRVSQ